MADEGALLVLGAGGFLGPWLTAAVLRRAAGRTVVAASRAPAAALSPEVAAGVETARVELAREGAARELLERLRPAGVCLGAALSRVADCARDPARAALVNAGVPREVARWCAEHGARLVAVSTDLVFGAQAPRAGGFGEGEPPAPLHVYGRTKAAGESAALEQHPAALVVRLPLLFGPSGGRGLGASDAVLEAVARGERPGLFTDEWRTPLDVRDAAGALAECLDAAHAGILHVAGPDRLSRHELGLLTLRSNGMGPDAAALALRETTRAEAGITAERAADVSLDAARARTLLRTALRSPAEALGAGAA